MNWLKKIAGGPSLQILMSLRQSFIEEAQQIYNEWQTRMDEYGDEQYGFGGICDTISRAIEEVIAANTNFESAEGGEEGGDHSWVVVKTPEGYYSIDLPYCVYERRKGFMEYEKIPDVQLSPEHIEIDFLGNDPVYWPERWWDEVEE